MAKANSGQFVTPVVKDEEGRRLSRTMRRTDKLDVLMDFYYSAMAPVVEHGYGVFLYHGRRIKCEETPADRGMEDGAEVEFFLVTRPRVFVTPVLEDRHGRRFTFSIGRTDRMQRLMDFYNGMVPAEMSGETRFYFSGKEITREQKPENLMLEDEDVINVKAYDPFAD
ncbi:uncharacterized protein LOC100821657 [Brachypodium distachyon]|uniref:Rad60/SUMO-like domain-containing protein n=1 Tax=Brachypodium distachyon TaxID=15368 RepID=I1GT45_BRADI|nr:uncharacterized protein LOC100821657 [Brachypodium distachyon]KQK15578.1 hypothetical protein BRADI_1g23800v3 [Brachypodium distachyon]|eukprot:XP_003560046.1 uncharacterized protein LOC100821657 [Brachypodium distachyon]